MSGPWCRGLVRNIKIPFVLAMITAAPCKDDFVINAIVEVNYFHIAIPKILEKKSQTTKTKELIHIDLVGQVANMLIQLIVL